jgi:hypothetical protein
MMADDDIPARVAERQQTIVELFTDLCADPDDRETAAGLDQALHELDALLAGTAGSR